MESRSSARYSLPAAAYAGVRTADRQVGGVARRDLAGQDRVDGAPGVHLHVDGRAGVALLETGDDPLPVPLAAGGGRVAVLGGDQAQRDLLVRRPLRAPRTAAGRREREDGRERGGRPRRCPATPVASSLAPSLVVVSPHVVLRPCRRSAGPAAPAGPAPPGPLPDVPGRCTPPGGGLRTTSGRRCPGLSGTAMHFRARVTSTLHTASTARHTDRTRPPAGPHSPAGTGAAVPTYRLTSKATTAPPHHRTTAPPHHHRTTTAPPHHRRHAATGTTQTERTTAQPRRGRPHRSRPGGPP
ncbi:hypothetical protein SDIAM26S_02573 [Streptomyces diastaticus subsp. diastaticus]